MKPKDLKSNGILTWVFFIIFSGAILPEIEHPTGTFEWVSAGLKGISLFVIAHMAEELITE